jgi:hypothetical protein
VFLWLAPGKIRVPYETLIEHLVMLGMMCLLLFRAMGWFVYHHFIHIIGQDPMLTEMPRLPTSFAWRPRWFLGGFLVRSVLRWQLRGILRIAIDDFLELSHRLAQLIVLSDQLSDPGSNAGGICCHSSDVIGLLGGGGKVFMRAIFHH